MKWIWISYVPLLTIHIYELVQLLFGDIPIYLAFLFAVVTIWILYGILSFLYKGLESVGKIVHSFFFIIQGCVIALYFLAERSSIYWIVLILFIGLEGLRVYIARKIDSLQNCYQQMVEERIHMNEMFRTVRSERHDFMKHVAALQFMLGSNEINSAKSYMNELVEGYEETNLSLKGETGAVAGILHQMYRKAAAEQIEVVYHLDIPLSALPLKEQDLVMLVGNILANAIESALVWQEVKQDTSQVMFQLYKRSGLFVLTCKNHSLPIPTVILDHLFERFGQTTKEGAHEGLGTKIIADLVKQYDGYLDFIYKEEEFTLKIKFPAIV